MSVANALKLRRQQKDQPSPTSEAPESGTPIRLRLHESIQTALTWTTQWEPSKRRILQSMAPQIMRMIGLEADERLERFVRKTATLCVYILHGEGAVITLEAEEMVVYATGDDPDATDVRSDQPEGEGAGSPTGGDGLGKDDPRGTLDLGLLHEISNGSDIDLGLQAEIPG